MKKAIMFTLAAMAAISITPSMEAEAAGRRAYNTIVIGNSSGIRANLEECLKNAGANIQIIRPGSNCDIMNGGNNNGNNNNNNSNNNNGSNGDNNNNGGNTDKPDDNQSESEFAAEVLRLVNEERSKAGLPALVLDQSVEKAANVRAKEIVSSFSHTRPNGTSFSTALKESGASYRGAGENIAWGQKTPAQVMEGWMNSAGHRANILNKSFTKIGVGYYQSGGTNYWTQIFTY